MSTTDAVNPDPDEVQGSEGVSRRDGETTTQAISEVLAHTERRGGPRSAIGKGRSKYNAVKHGLLAKVILLSYESRAQFDGLLFGLKQDLKPKGLLEATLVEKLATTLWRYRRLLQAENAELLRNIEDRRTENAEQNDRISEFRARQQEFKAKTDIGGLMPKIEDPQVLESCIQELETVRTETNSIGIEDGAQDVPLGLVYGARYEGRPGHDLFDYFCECVAASHASEAERQKRGFESKDDCVDKFINELEKEIHRMESLRKYPLPRGKRRVKDSLRPTRTQLLKCMMPNSSGLDGLLRYEASLERAIGRTLIQLECVRRIRDAQTTIHLTQQARSPHDDRYRDK